jgi:hypothetical protein
MKKRIKIREFKLDESKDSPIESIGLSVKDLEDMGEYLNGIANTLYRGKISTKELIKIIGETLTIEELVINAVTLMKLQILLVEKKIKVGLHSDSLDAEIIEEEKKKNDDDDLDKLLNKLI